MDSVSPGKGGTERNGTGTAYASFALGAVTSIAANIAHVTTRHATAVDPGAVIASAFAPMALLLVVEMLLRTRHVGGALGFLRWTAASVVAGVAAVVSYGHMFDLLTSYGESKLVACILPLAVDGLMVVASVVLAAPAFSDKVSDGKDGKTESASVPDVVPEEAPEAMPEAVPASVPEAGKVADAMPEVVPESVPVPKPRKTARQADVPSLAATADVREDARAAWIAAKDEDGTELSGRALAERFGKSERWGRSRVSEAKAEVAERSVSV